MIYLKSYCYSKHELPFIKAQLDESKGHVDKFYLYEFDRTHTGVEKNFELDSLLPEDDRLIYKKISLKDNCVNASNDESKVHTINEPIQRSYIFNDENVKLNDEDILFDVDVDEIIYASSYPKLIETYTSPTSMKLNQFFFKHNYLWTNCNFSSPTIYKYKDIKHTIHKLNGLNVSTRTRDLPRKTIDVVGCHMSWVMPVDNMVKKLHSYGHIKYKHLADSNILQKAVDDKKYIFDLKRPFNIDELELNDERIPKILQIVDIFNNSI
tara:strand:- start:510 stop:1310 length:801 start_codon:yes stop_codon:yes gene_type:complete